MLEATDDNEPIAAAGEAASISKSARKRLLKQQRLQARKIERKAAEKERRREDLERRRREWEEKLADKTEEERTRLVESRKETRRERMEKRTEERSKRAERLRTAAVVGQKVVLDLEFSDLMSPSEIQSLAHQIMYCYAVNGKCEYPAHLWLTGCNGNIGSQLQRLPGYDKWIIEKESRPYIEVFQDHKEKLIYLTADAETTLEELDTNRIYIIGGLVDRNRWKGITMKKANEQGIQSAKLPIGNYIKLASSQVLTVNQVVEILLKFVETRDWKKAFFTVIPQRKRGAVEIEGGDTIDVAKIEKECNEEGLEADAEEVEEEYTDNETIRTKKQRSESKTEETDIIKASAS
ncbi:tRNA (guanine(9)-N1)-methyltransferase [Dendrobium catenatum]|uniref:tRNA (guanine(9)-N(1))-methyltransferase n=1 Tax=Dendrobium catenatum TaxID=906689 RepID=A0A2I0WZA2_9ASPA|nr:tRNA (guanine(9)-N1)-methyltransferase [Dendrobium catenatum]PKU80971.1 tRNA (guanine9-N1)-methyltransferase [Dendrobium catenatum]